MSGQPFQDLELLAVPEESGRLLVYAPLHGVALRVGPRDANTLVRLRDGVATQADLDSPLATAMTNAGLADAPIHAAPRCVPGNGAFSPSRLTLFLTTACTLRCVYCYAEDGRSPMTMPVELGRAAVDQLFRYAREAERARVDVSFHGGGEPTCAWDELTALVEYAAASAERAGIECRFGIATNGCMSAAQARWIGRQFDNVNLSLDGPPRIQDRQRPRAGGGRSSVVLRRTMRELESAECPYACQATVLGDTVSTLADTVRYVARYTSATELKFEPVMPDGRFQGRDDAVPGAEEFADAFDEAHALGQRLGLAVQFSALRLDRPPLSCFCGAFDTPFAVTPDGYMSACYEAFSASCDHLSTFLVGRYDSASGSFRVDRDKLDRLRERQVQNMPTCANCFCKYTCAGDCASRNFSHFGRQDLFAVGARCELIRAVVRRRLQRMLDAHEQDGFCRLPRPKQD